MSKKAQDAAKCYENGNSESTIGYTKQILNFL